MYIPPPSRGYMRQVWSTMVRVQEGQHEEMGDEGTVYSDVVGACGRGANCGPAG